MVSSRRLLILVVVAAFLLALTATRLVQGRHGGGEAVVAAATVEPAASAVPTIAAPPASVPAATTSEGADVVVDVVGAVRRPGIVRVRPDARVADAVRAAGGLTRKADLGSVNEAAKVVDGAQIVVRARGATAGLASPSGTAFSGPAAKGSPTTTVTAPVSLSTATLEELDALPGVGPATAQKIVDYRTEHGRFQTVDDLLDVSGIGPAKLEALRSVAVP